MRKYLTKRNVLILVAIILVGGFFVLRPKNNKNLVKTAKVTRGDLVETLSVSGKVDASRKATLNFPAPGKLGYVKVQAGDSVAKGTWLAALDLSDLQASERAAYYNYLAADANAKQTEDVVKGHDNDETFAQKNARVAAQTARDKAYDGWLVAQRAIGNAVLKSPIAGVVTDVTVSTPGDTVGVTDGVTVVDPETLYFDTSVNETDIQSVTVGQKAKVNLDAFANEQFEGEVIRVGYATKIGDTGATVLPVRISLPASLLSRLKVGLNGDADVILGESKNTLLLPQEAVRDGKVTLKDNKEVKVETGRENDLYVEIKSGLAEGQEVVVK